MKKLITMLLVFVMLAVLTMAAAADGEEAEPTTLNWITARRGFIQYGIQGSFYEIPDFGMDIWVPNFLTPKDDIPADTYYVFISEDESAFIKVHKVDTDGVTTLTGLEELVKEIGFVSDGFFWINGYGALIYESEENDMIGILIPFDDGDVIEFIFTPKSNQEYYSLYSMLMSTIQPHKLGVADVASMINADLKSTWGPDRNVRYIDDQDNSEITIYMWEDGVTTENINTDNWEAVREDRINNYNMYADVLNEFGMGQDVLLNLMYISPDEDQSFLTISGGQIEYDFTE